MNVQVETDRGRMMWELIGQVLNMLKCGVNRLADGAES